MHRHCCDRRACAKARAYYCRLVWRKLGRGVQPCVAQAFTKATGIAVVPEVGTSTTTLAKLQQQGIRRFIDVAYMDGGISELANAAGVLEALDPARLKNMAQMSKQAVYREGQSVFAVGSGYYSLGLTYNTKEIKQPPTSWGMTHTHR